MTSQEAAQKFQQSKTLFAQKRYPEALIMLDEINAAFPDQKDVLYGRAMCLAELQRPLEAIRICEQAVAMHNDQKSQALLNRLRREHGAIQEGPTDLASLMGHDATRQSGAAAAPSAPSPAPDFAEMPRRSSNKRFYVTLACVVGVLLILLIGFPFVVGKVKTGMSSSDTATDSGDLSPDDSPPQPVQWYYKYDEGMNIASQYKRPVCIFFYDGAEESSRLEETVFQTPFAQKALAEFINIRVLYSQEDPAVIKYGVKAVPSIVLQDTSGNIVYSASGTEISSEDFRTKLQAFLKT